MIRSIALLSILLPSLASGAEILPLDADDYTLTLTHEVRHPQVRLPNDEIPKAEYLLVKERKTVRLRFSDDRKKVEILPRGVSGELTSADAHKRVYQLTKGLFAGGRFAIETTETGLTATLTEFGSGVPVISSARGEVKPTTRKAEQGGTDPLDNAPGAESDANTNAVYAKVLLAVKPPAAGEHPPVESWIAQRLRKRGVTELRAVTGWVRLAEMGEDRTALWNAVLDGDSYGCPGKGWVSARTANGKVRVDFTGWAPFPSKIKGNSLPAEIGSRGIAVVDGGRTDGVSYVALMIVPAS